MERLDGLDLGEVLRHERRVAPDRVVAIGTQVCRALSAAHAAGIIHRDLKPENIFLVSREGVPDFVKVLDFGIAKQDMGNQNSPRRLTTPGIAMGTPEYMAPEQAAGKAIDGRVDIYSVGAILYEMLTADSAASRRQRDGDPRQEGDRVADAAARAQPRRARGARGGRDALPRARSRSPAADDGRARVRADQVGQGARLGGGRGARAQAGNEDVGSSWGEESSKPRLFDTSAIQGRRASMPSIPVQRTGTTGAMPLSADEDRVRVNSQRVPSRDGFAEALAADDKRLADRTRGGTSRAAAASGSCSACWCWRPAAARPTGSCATSCRWW